MATTAALKQGDDGFGTVSIIFYTAVSEAEETTRSPGLFGGGFIALMVILVILVCLCIICLPLLFLCGCCGMACCSCLACAACCEEGQCCGGEGEGCCGDCGDCDCGDCGPDD